MRTCTTIIGGAADNIKEAVVQNTKWTRKALAYKMFSNFNTHSKHVYNYYSLENNCTKCHGTSKYSRLPTFHRRL